MINKVNGNGVSRAVFDYIGENQGVQVNKAMEALVDCGFKRSSVGSLISQMVAQGMIDRTPAGYLWPLISEYRPLKSMKKKRISRPVVKALAIVAKEKPDAPVVRMTSAKVLETMSVKEAHALYLELLTMFGDAK
jgi:hypothetical protein